MAKWLWGEIRKRCKVCDSDLKFYDGSCPTCEKAKKLLSLPDLREVWQHEMETEEDRFIRAAKAQQEAPPPPPPKPTPKPMPIPFSPNAFREEEYNQYKKAMDIWFKGEVEIKKKTQDTEYRRIGSREIYDTIPTYSYDVVHHSGCQICETTVGPMEEEDIPTPEGVRDGYRNVVKFCKSCFELYDKCLEKIDGEDEYGDPICGYNNLPDWPELEALEQARSEYAAEKQSWVADPKLMKVNEEKLKSAVGTKRE